MEFIRPELPIDIIEPAITITETTIPVSGGGRGGGGGGAGERFERDFGSGFGREVVVGGDLTDRQNIQ